MARTKNPYINHRHKATPEEIEQDPSLRYFVYQRGELVWSDERQEYVRFLNYTEDETKILLTDYHFRPLAGEYDPLQVRRPRAGKGTGPNNEDK